jgi:hypothetical protein
MRCASGAGKVSYRAAWGVGRKIVHDAADAVRVGIVRIGEIAHALGEVAGGPVVGHLHMAPGLVGVEEDEQIGRAIALVFAIVSHRLSRCGRDWQAGFADQLGRAFVASATMFRNRICVGRD